MGQPPENWQRELAIPPPADTDAEAFEIVRSWACGGKQVVALRGLYIRDSAAWGIFLADLVRHIARSYHLNYGDDLTATVRTVRAAFEAEMDHVTDWGEGNLRR